MTMSVKELEIIIPVLSALGAGDDMVDFPYVSFLEIQSALRAFSFLSFKECGYPLVDFRMFAHSGAPIYPVSIIRASTVLHFNVPFNRSFSVFG
jgi:hypothetical protein